LFDALQNRDRAAALIVREKTPLSCSARDGRLLSSRSNAATSRRRTRAVGVIADKRLRKDIPTSRWRARQRERVGVEHRFARLVRHQGRRARHRRNLFIRASVQRKVA